MTVYSGPVFDMAVKQFGVIADYLAIPTDDRDRLLMPFIATMDRRLSSRDIAFSTI